MTKPNLRTVGYKELEAWVKEAPDGIRIVQGMKIVTDKDNDTTRKLDIYVGEFKFWFANWYSDRNRAFIITDNPHVADFQPLTEACKLISDVFGVENESTKLKLYENSEQLDESEIENIKLQAQVEVYKSLIPTDNVTFKKETN